MEKEEIKPKITKISYKEHLRLLNEVEEKYKNIREKHDLVFENVSKLYEDLSNKLEVQKKNYTFSSKRFIKENKKVDRDSTLILEAKCDVLTEVIIKVNDIL